MTSQPTHGAVTLLFENLEEGNIVSLGCESHVLDMGHGLVEVGQREMRSAISS